MIWPTLTRPVQPGTGALRVLTCGEQQQQQHNSRPEPSRLDALRPLLIRPFHPAAAPGLLPRCKLAGSMGLNTSKPALSPPASGQNEHEHWRAEAKRRAEARNALYQQSQEAYRAGKGAEAKALSVKAKAEGRLMERANRAASEAAFQHFNAGRQDDAVDLHGLFVKEALERARAAIRQAKSRGKADLVFIVGRGNHSAGGVQRLKPAIEQLAREERLTCMPNKPNAGCVYVILEGEGKVEGGFSAFLKGLAAAFRSLLRIL